MYQGETNAYPVNGREINGPYTYDITNVKCGTEWGGTNGHTINAVEINGPITSNRERCRRTQVI